jgi:hypothetical protein
MWMRPNFSQSLKHCCLAFQRAIGAFRQRDSQGQGGAGRDRVFEVPARTFWNVGEIAGLDGALAGRSGTPKFVEGGGAAGDAPANYRQRRSKHAAALTVVMTATG